MRRHPVAALVCAVATSSPLRAQGPFAHRSAAIQRAVVTYTLRVDSADLSGFDVTMTLRDIPDTFRLGMVAHPEYDDRFWRFVTALRVETGGVPATVVREDSALWRVVSPGGRGQALVRYRILLPDTLTVGRAAWRPFLAPSGGLVGGPHAFMFVVGATHAPAGVTLELPPGWEAATGLEPSADLRRFSAPGTAVLVDSPILVGRFRTWRFTAGEVPHRVVYWPLPDAAPFDTLVFVGHIERLVRQAVALFGRAPYREYTFLFQDGAYGGLEHLNSVTLGAPSVDLGRDPDARLGETAHEFFHTWNLMRIHPLEYGDVDYRPQPRTRGLWFSEGLTMFYADLLRRRASLPVPDSSRPAHLAGLIERYLASPGNSRFAPESVSVVAYGASPGVLGDYQASTHLQGELLATMLDLIVRDATDGRRSLDDVMRAMLERFGEGARGFSGDDIERTVATVCGCAVRSFFDAYVRTGTPIDFDRYLRLAGLRARRSRGPALGSDGNPVVDRRAFAWLPPGARAPVLLLSDPASAWGRAGLHTGDTILAVNDTPLATRQDFGDRLRRLRLGDTLRLQVARGQRTWTATVVARGYDRPFVSIEPLPAATERQRALRARWLAGDP